MISKTIPRQTGQLNNKTKKKKPKPKTATNKETKHDTTINFSLIQLQFISVVS